MVCVCVCGWSCLKLITVSFGSYRLDLKVKRLVKYKYKLKYVNVVHLFFVIKITRHPVHV